MVTEQSVAMPSVKRVVKMTDPDESEYDSE